jgi:hypothetical protein
MLERPAAIYAPLLLHHHPPIHPTPAQMNTPKPPNTPNTTRQLTVAESHGYDEAVGGGHIARAGRGNIVRAGLGVGRAAAAAAAALDGAEVRGVRRSGPSSTVYECVHV